MTWWFLQLRFYYGSVVMSGRSSRRPSWSLSRVDAKRREARTKDHGMHHNYRREASYANQTLTLSAVTSKVVVLAMSESTNNPIEKLGRTVINGIITAIPICVTFIHNGHKFYKQLPTDYIHLLIGAILCFFGGVYPTVFAALQAAEHGGLTTVKKALKALGDEVMIIINESKKDDKSFIDRSVVPIIDKATPAEYKKWVPVLTDWMCKSIGVGVAWKIQTIITAFTSSLAGGLMMSRAVIVILAKHGKGPKDHNDTIVDEVASYVFAFLGFYFQFTQDFRAPFPLNVILAPVQLAEYYIRWAVTD
eukprot:scaffold9044_cov137-Skeletonema_marinoi.AAC.4